MTGRIIKDYFLTFRWSNFNTKVANFAYMIVYFTAILPAMAGFFEKPEYALVYILMAIPLAHTANSGATHIMRLPKIMYMVPMSQEMKREYIVKSAIFRICFCTFLGVVCTIPLVALNLCEWTTGILIIYNVLTMALILCGMNERYGIEDREKYPEVKTDGRGIVQGVDIFVTIISSFLIACMLCLETNVFPVANWMFAIPAVLVQLPLTIKHMSHWNKAVEKAMGYEASYDK